MTTLDYNRAITPDISASVPGSVPDNRAFIDVAQEKVRPLAVPENAPLLIFASDIVAYALSFFAVFLISAQIAHIFYHVALAVPTVSALRDMLIGQATVFCFVAYIFWLQGHYRDRGTFWDETRVVVSTSLFAALISSFAILGRVPQPYALASGGAWLCFALFAPIGRQVAKHALHRLDAWQVPTLLVGADEHCHGIRAALASDSLPGLRTVGHIDISEFITATDDNHGRGVLRRYGASRALLVCDTDHGVNRAAVQRLVRDGVPFTLVPRGIELPVHGMRKSSFFSHDDVMFTYYNNLDQPLARAVKILFDITVATSLFVVLLPFFVAIAALVKLDGGPAFFGHRRLGMNGRHFHCLKFRTMVVNSAEVLKELLARDPAAAEEWARTQKLTNDPRVTAIGRFLRKTSLDELPQLINVLRLEMSLVGPRPIVDAEAGHYGEYIELYYKTRPGVSGLWQVSGRSDTSYAERVRLDGWYVRNWAIWHDVAILLKTLPAVLAQRGAR